MNYTEVMLILGTRPQIIKSAPFIHIANKEEQVDLSIIHTGQHYDYDMTKIFFEELNLPEPLINLNVGSGTHAQQIARMIIPLEKILRNKRTDLLIVPGDTNSTLAGALAAAKLHIPVAHMEAGARSFDMKMPEEINRKLTDHCSTLLFTVTEHCTENLVREGISKDRIHQTGDTMYEALLNQLPKAERTPILQTLDLEPKKYALLTMHRPENVDNLTKLRSIINAMMILKPLEIIFPAHPRTRKQLKKIKLYNKIREQKHIRIVNPFGYQEMLKLIKNATLILTDSGGMQKEAFWLKTPCITLRETTEWQETIELGVNQLTGANTQKIIKAVSKILEKEERIAEDFRKLKNPFGDGKASQEIINTIKSFKKKSS